MRLVRSILKRYLRYVRGSEYQSVSGVTICLMLHDTAPWCGMLSPMSVRSFWLLVRTGTRCRTHRSRASETCSMGDMSAYACHGRTDTRLPGIASRSLRHGVVRYHAETLGDCNGPHHGIFLLSNYHRFKCI